MSWIESYIRSAAEMRGIDPDTAVTVARYEGGLDDPVQQSYYTKNGFREPSYGPFQLLVGGAGTGFPKGLGNEFIDQTGLDPTDPDNAKAAIDFALDNAAKKGWGAWYGAGRAGLSKWSGIDKNSHPGWYDLSNLESVPIPESRPDFSTELAYSPELDSQKEASPFDSILNGSGADTNVSEGMSLANQYSSYGLGKSMYGTPQAPSPTDQNMGFLADQYSSYGLGHQAADQALAEHNLSLDVAEGRQANDLYTVDTGYVDPMVKVQTKPPNAPRMAAPIAAPQMSVQSRVMSPSPPPISTGMDVWQGRANSGIATDGSRLSRNPNGTISRTSKYGITTTMNEDGSFGNPNSFGTPGRNFSNSIGRGLALGIPTVIGGIAAGPVGALAARSLASRAMGNNNERSASNGNDGLSHGGLLGLLGMDSPLGEI